MTLNITRRASLVAILAATGTLMTAGRLFAQEAYPSRTVSLIVPFGAGGLNDSTARLWADKANAELEGGSIIVENKPGGGGLVGALDVVRAKPDGYTLMLGSSTTQVILPLAAKTKRYDPLTDFQAVSIFALATAAIVVHPSVPAETLEEFIAYAKANPGVLSYGSAGIGTNSHLTGELFKTMAGGLDIIHAPYGGAGPAMQDLLGGHILVATPHVTEQLIAFHKSGQVRILAVAAPQRMAAAPDIPTGEELGLTGLIGQTFNGIFAPAGIDATAVQTIANASDKALRDPDFIKLLTSSGYEALVGVSGQAAQDYVAAEVMRLTEVLKLVPLELS